MFDDELLFGLCMFLSHLEEDLVDVVFPWFFSHFKQPKLFFLVDLASCLE